MHFVCANIFGANVLKPRFKIDVVIMIICRIVIIINVSHLWCDLFYRLLHSYTRHAERVVRGERDTVLSAQE